MFISSKWVFKQREEWHKSSASALIGLLKHLQTCHYCSSWNEHQKSGRSPTVTFRKFPYYRFDISNSLRFKHAVFEASQFQENVKNNTGTLQFYQTVFFLFFMKCDSVQHIVQATTTPPPPQKKKACILYMHLSNFCWKTANILRQAFIILFLVHL